MPESDLTPTQETTEQMTARLLAEAQGAPSSVQQPTQQAELPPEAPSPRRRRVAGDAPQVSFTDLSRLVVAITEPHEDDGAMVHEFKAKMRDAARRAGFLSPLVTD